MDRARFVYLYLVGIVLSCGFVTYAGLAAIGYLLLEVFVDAFDDDRRRGGWDATEEPEPESDDVEEPDDDQPTVEFERVGRHSYDRYGMSE